MYLPDELYRRARERGLSISTLAQRALDEALRIEDNRVWIERARQQRPRARSDFDTAALMDEVREEFGA